MCTSTLPPLRAHGLDPRRDSLDRTAGVVVAGDHEHGRGDVLDVGHRVALSVGVGNLIGAAHRSTASSHACELGRRGPVRRDEVARGDPREDRAESIRVGAGVEAREAPAPGPAAPVGARGIGRSVRDQRVETRKDVLAIPSRQTRPISASRNATP